MKTRKVWLGLGTAILVAPPAGAEAAWPSGGVAAPGAESARSVVLAQHGGHGAPAAKAGGEGEGEGARAGDAGLSPSLRFYRDVQLIRGHLSIGQELVEAGRWADALPHFLHPTEEIYGTIKAELRTYDTPAFEIALKALAQTVKARNKEAYARALATVNERLDAADRGVQAKETGHWAHFALETALEMLRIAGDEYANAVDGKRFKLPVEYQDSRGFVLQSERLVDSVAADLGKKDAEALAAIRAAFADLKQAWPSVTPPKAPVKDVSDILSDISRIELLLSRFR